MSTLRTTTSGTTGSFFLNAVGVPKPAMPVGRVARTIVGAGGKTKQTDARRCEQRWYRLKLNQIEPVNVKRSCQRATTARAYR